MHGTYARLLGIGFTTLVVTALAVAPVSAAPAPLVSIDDGDGDAAGSTVLDAVAEGDWESAVSTVLQADGGDEPGDEGDDEGDDSDGDDDEGDGGQGENDDGDDERDRDETASSGSDDARAGDDGGLPIPDLPDVDPEDARSTVVDLFRGVSGDEGPPDRDQPARRDGEDRRGPPSDRRDPPARQRQVGQPETATATATETTAQPTPSIPIVQETETPSPTPEPTAEQTNRPTAPRSPRPTPEPSTGVREDAGPTIGVAGVEPNRSTVRTGQPVTVLAQVTNHADQAQRVTLEMQLFGDVVDVRDVRVPASSSRTVEFVRAIEAPGVYHPTVNGVETTVRVTADDDGGTATATPTSGGSGPGFGVVAWILALVGVGLLARRS